MTRVRRLAVSLVTARAYWGDVKLVPDIRTTQPLRAPAPRIPANAGLSAPSAEAWGSGGPAEEYVSAARGLRR